MPVRKRSGSTGSAEKADKATLYAVPALEKGLDVLELLAHQRDGLTATQIARELNRTVSEIFRMIICLKRRGYILLAHQTPDQRERLLAEWSRETGKTAPRDLTAHLHRIEKAGYEKRASYLVKGVVNISFPIFDDRGAAIGALTVPFIQHAGSSTQESQVIEALRRAASEITAAIGGKATAV